MELFTLVFGALTAAALYKGVIRWQSWQKNIALARSSGLPVVLIPWHIFSTWWLASFYIWVPIIEAILPAS